MDKLFTKKNIINFIQVNIGTFILALALHFFLIPSKLASGGATGFSLVVSTITGISMPLILMLVNVVLIILAVFTIGASFGILTVYSALILSVFLYIIDSVSTIPVPLNNDLFINLIFGVLINSIGIAIVLNAGASTGGTDILCKIIEKYTPLSFGTGLLLCDGLITMSAFATYGVHTAMYGLLGVLLNSFFIDRFIAGFNIKYNVCITSDKIDEINNFILKDLSRGSTIYKAQGGFSNDDKRIIMSILDKKQYISLKNFVKSIDPVAFLYVYTVSEIEGNGFTK